MIRLDFECTAGHEFTMWDTEPRLCPTCGVEFLKRIFLTAPSVNHAKTAIVDNLVRTELESRGITNIHSGGEGHRDKVTLKSTEADLAAQKVYREHPQLNDPQGLQKAQDAMKQRWSNVGVAGVIKSGLPANDVLRSALPTGTRMMNGKNMIFPSAEPNAFKRNDAKMVQRMVRKDPENLQVKK